MSVTVSVKFAHDAVFFSGEPFLCTITFTNPYPPTSQTKNITTSPRLSNESGTSKLTNGFTTNPVRSINDPKNQTKKGQKQVQNGSPLSVIVENPSIKNSLAGDLGDSGIFGFRNFVKRSASLTAIASSTFSLLTGIESSPGSPIDPSTSSALPTSSHNLSQTEKIKMEIIDDATKENTDGGSDTMSLDFDTRESTPRSSVDFYGLGNNNSERNSSTWVGAWGDKSHSRKSNTMSRCSSSPSLTQKYETLLWSFAQIVGHFIVDGSLVKSAEFEPLKHKAMYRPASAGIVGTGGAVGGGMLGIFGPNGKSSSNSGEYSEKADNRTIPVFSTPPSILFVDLYLSPGESRTYTYETRLPDDLPPTHRGKAIRFHYNLIIGTHRGGMNHQSHIVQLPFRVFNHVAEDGTRPVYDLMNPLIIYKDDAIVTCIEEKKTPKPVKKKVNNKCAEFLDYVEKLVQTSKNQNHLPSPNSESDRDSESYVILENSQKSCANTVLMLAKNMRKANYDICKNNARVGQLCLLKTSYRLGDIVHGIINFTDALIPSYQVSITLENSELVELSVANRPQSQISRLTRKIHGEHHEFCLNSNRISFAISIPTSSTPDFSTTGVKLQWGLRVEFITGSKGKPSLLAFNADDRHQYYQAVSEVDVETFDCFIPIKVYPSSHESARTFSSQHNFNVS